MPFLKKVDMVLLGGDLFHDNKPSRKSLYQVMRSLRKNVLGPKPCSLEFLSDANEVFEGAFPTVNYEDPDINVSVPVFSIHGNHDDPSGEGHFCSLDLLHVAGLVNYFGRIPEADNIEAKPLLLQKGATRLALFGLGNVRDERMFRTFRDNRVKWFRPAAGAGAGDWFNLLTVHQNHHAHTATSYLPENVLPDWMDLVVWGHEHECLIDPKQNPETGFHVMQPGSSVATSLVAGEAVAKHVAIVSVTGKDFTVDKIPLRSVRPFVTREIVLGTDRRFRGLESKKENRQEVTRRLMEVVDEMIVEALEGWRALREGDDNDDDEDEEQEPPLPLIRLKVEYSAGEGGKFDVENPQRFSNRFVGRVANTNDVVYFYRKKSGARRGDNSAAEVAPEALASLSNSIKVDRLVSEFLAAQSLKILPQAPFGDAVNQFVTKDDKHAMETFVSESLAGQVRQMLDLDSDEEDLESAMEAYRAKLEEQFGVGGGAVQRRGRRVLRERPEGWDSDLDGRWESQPGAFVEAEESLVPQDDEMDVDDEPVRKAPVKRTSRAKTTTTTTKTKAAPKKPAPAKKAPAKTTRAKKAAAPPSDDELDDDDDEPAPPPARKPASTTTTARRQPARATRQTRLNFSQSQGRSQAEALEISDDEISDDFEPRRR